MENLARRVAVVGAGYAGMAAAVSLAGRGIPVTVFEAGAVPGGRARRVVSRGETLDNGQHILIGAYETLFRLMRTVGVPADALLRVPLELRYAGGEFALRGLWLPGAAGLLGGLLLARGVPFAERLGALRFMTRLKRAAFRLPADLPVRELLASHGQNGRLAGYLWNALCIAALNTPPEQASAQAFLAVLRDTLAGPPGAADLLLPRVDLSRLFPEPAAAYVTGRGGEMRLGTRVTDVKALQGFGAVILAVAPQHLRRLVPDWPLECAFQPITTCYLQYEESARLPLPMLGMARGLVQWVFDRGALMGEQGRFACVISAEGPHQALSRDELAARCAAELAQCFPSLGAPRASCVITEKRATVACTSGWKRPPLEHDGLLLAGDYTDSEYPPTLEAAVRSGVRAAERASERVL